MNNEYPIIYGAPSFEFHGSHKERFVSIDWASAVINQRSALFYSGDKHETSCFE